MFQKAALISAQIADRRMCLDCLSANTSMQSHAVETAIEILGRALVIRRYSDKCCDECGTRTTVFYQERP